MLSITPVISLNSEVDPLPADSLVGGVGARVTGSAGEVDVAGTVAGDEATAGTPLVVDVTLGVVTATVCSAKTGPARRLANKTFLNNLILMIPT